MARLILRRTTMLAATAVGVSAGLVLAAAPASADIFSNIRACESGGNYGTNTGNGYYGAYQFTQQTWNSLGYSGVPSSASPATQDAAAAQLAARSGFGQWPVCGAGGGSAASAATSQPAYTPGYTGYSAASRSFARPALVSPVPVIYGFFSLENASQVRNDVKLYQRALNKHHFHLKVDGQMGQQTVLATLDWQKTHHLKLVDGIVGPETWHSLGLKPKKKH